MFELCFPLNCLKKHYTFYRLTSKIPLQMCTCTTFVHKIGPLSSKPKPRAEKYVFIGYYPSKKGYKCFNPTT